MKLADMTWYQVQDRIDQRAAVILPTGSTEQHGPMGRIGTDTTCAEAVALETAHLCNAIVAPPLAYTPAPFNTGFPGTVSLSPTLFEAMAREIVSGLLDQGFVGVFVVNGHGANLEPLRAIASENEARMHILSWWEPDEVNALRQNLYGSWEGMHATPSEVAITQHLQGVLPENEAASPPAPLSAEYIRDHSGDRHGPTDQHRAQFPDGRVGSHSALATPEDGERLLRLSAQGVAQAFVAFQTRAMALS
ncbi:creatininase family protein [Shimia abyssi]|uniref:Creatinine amidohydrolase n=1 Tax=Shimia abyssi TaxID=1662395 RepID=A0A2P8F613_9RHOB|nr:creatininase family protein [Shimia abyssi]PSL17132.1 creatinine amidohydrolase [Shimia abyssi]